MYKKCTFAWEWIEMKIVCLMEVSATLHWCTYCNFKNKGMYFSVIIKSSGIFANYVNRQINFKWIKTRKSVSDNADVSNIDIYDTIIRFSNILTYFEKVRYAGLFPILPDYRIQKTIVSLLLLFCFFFIFCFLKY